MTSLVVILGNVHDCPPMEALSATPAWRVFQDRQDRIADECGDCAHLNFCRGGCPYNALVANGGKFDGMLRDPHCPAYKRVFSYVTDRALAEVFSEENLCQNTTNLTWCWDNRKLKTNCNTKGEREMEGWHLCCGIAIVLVVIMAYIIYSVPNVEKMKARRDVS